MEQKYQISYIAFINDLESIEVEKRTGNVDQVHEILSKNKMLVSSKLFTGAKAYATKLIGIPPDLSYASQRAIGDLSKVKQWHLRIKTI